MLWDRQTLAESDNLQVIEIVFRLVALVLVLPLIYRRVGLPPHRYPAL